MPGERQQTPVYSVSALIGEMRHLLESSYRNIRVEGEISSLAAPASGHLYFSLKEKDALVRCAFFRNRRTGSVTPGEGMQVIVRGQISIYPGRGDLQLIVSQVEPAGEGALRRAFEQLKLKLAAEGMFDSERKQPLPQWPVTVGIVSSASGAALHDMLVTLRKRFPVARVVIYPVLVQGDQAADSICDMLGIAAARNEVDVLLLARGGGSLEDLQPFNDERVARAIATCPLPVVSGVGHETDFTIADMVADARGATPTAAATLVTPDLGEFVTRFGNFRSRLIHQVQRSFNYKRQHIDFITTRLVHPTQMLARLYRLREENTRRIQQVALSVLKLGRLTLDRSTDRLQSGNPARLLRLQRSHIDEQKARLLRTTNAALATLDRGLDHRRKTLQIVNPAHTLRRGYAILQNQSGVVVTSRANTRDGEVLDATVSDGRFRVTVNKP